jgi:hypothetical protein
METLEGTNAFADWSDNTNSPPCAGPVRWNGVRCSEYSCTGRVTAVVLHKGGITGYMTEFAAEGLEMLQQFNVALNRITGTFPQSITQFTELRMLNIAVNAFTGSLPNFPAINKVHNVHVERNYFSGEIPASFSKICSKQNTPADERAIYCNLLTTVESPCVQLNTTTCNKCRGIYQPSSTVPGQCQARL